MFGALRHFRSFAVLPVIIWMAMQLMMSSAGASAVQSGITAGNLGNADFIEIIICTPTGLKKVKIGPDGETQEDTETYPDCRWCQMFQSAAVLPAVFNSAERVFYDAERSRFEAFSQRTYGSIRCRDFLSRGPPILI